MSKDAFDKELAEQIERMKVQIELAEDRDFEIQPTNPYKSHSIDDWLGEKIENEKQKPPIKKITLKEFLDEED